MLETITVLVSMELACTHASCIVAYEIAVPALLRMILINMVIDRKHLAKITATAHHSPLVLMSLILKSPRKDVKKSADNTSGTL